MLCQSIYELCINSIIASVVEQTDVIFHTLNFEGNENKPKKWTTEKINFIK